MVLVVAKQFAANEISAAFLELSVRLTVAGPSALGDLCVRLLSVVAKARWSSPQLSQGKLHPSSHGCCLASCLIGLGPESFSSWLLRSPPSKHCYMGPSNTAAGFVKASHRQLARHPFTWTVCCWLEVHQNALQKSRLHKNASV